MATGVVGGCERCRALELEGVGVRMIRWLLGCLVDTMMASRLWAGGHVPGLISREKQTSHSVVNSSEFRHVFQRSRNTYIHVTWYAQVECCLLLRSHKAPGSCAEGARLVERYWLPFSIPCYCRKQEYQLYVVDWCYCEAWSLHSFTAHFTHLSHFGE